MDFVSRVGQGPGVTTSVGELPSICAIHDACWGPGNLWASEWWLSRRGVGVLGVPLVFLGLSTYSVKQLHAG